jgi:uncharacterized lipoprotein YmbA
MRMLVIGSIALLVGCAGAPPLPAQYLLRSAPPERTGQLKAPVRVGLGSIAVAPYLEQPGIVVKTETDQVRPARLHQWAEPLDAGLRIYLRAQLSEVLGYDVSTRRADELSWDYAVSVDVDQLHGTMAGNAVLEASYRIETGSSAAQPTEYRFSRTAPLSREGFPALVEAEARLVAELAGAIAASLRELGAP